MAKQRITEDFVKHLKGLREQTGNSRHNVHRALDRDPQIAVSIEELDRLWRAIEHHRKHSRLRFIVQADPKFAKALADYRERWDGVLFDLWDWRDKKAGRQTLSESLNQLERAANDTSPSTFSIDDEEWDFDPDDHSAALLVESAAEYMEMRKDDEAWFSRASGAFRWFNNTVGLKFSAIEERFKDFSVLVIPEHVSNKHGIEDARSLYAYLNDIRNAYIIGADLAAIAMCRACTEILMRIHYNQDERTKLAPLVKQTQQKREFAHLRQHNLVSKIDDANKLLHFDRQDIQTKDRERMLIRDWVTALQDMIANAPQR